MKRILPILALSVFLAGCPQSSYHKAVVAEHDAKSIVAAFQKAEMIEFQNGRISAEEHKAIEAQVEKIATAGGTLTAALQSNAPGGTVLSDLSALIKATGDVSNIVIKSDQSKGIVNAFVASLEAVLQNLQVILAAPSTTTIGGNQ